MGIANAFQDPEEKARKERLSKEYEAEVQRLRNPGMQNTTTGYNGGDDYLNYAQPRQETSMDDHFTKLANAFQNPEDKARKERLSRELAEEAARLKNVQSNDYGYDQNYGNFNSPVQNQNFNQNFSQNYDEPPQQFSNPSLQPPSSNLLQPNSSSSISQPFQHTDISFTSSTNTDPQKTAEDQL